MAASRKNSENIVYEALDNFRCYKDADIESFIRYKAVEFEKRGFCTVYLFLDRDMFEENKIFIHAYFTLSHKAMNFTEGVSKTMRGKIAFMRNAKLAHVVLIGQIGKYMNNDKLGNDICTSISSRDIFLDVFEIIRKSSEYIVCRGAIVECIDEEKIHQIYKNEGFKFLQIYNGRHQFYKRISEST